MELQNKVHSLLQCSDFEKHTSRRLREKQESEQFEKPPMAITNSRWHWRTTGWEKKEKKLQEEKSVKNTSSTCRIIRKMPQKPTESDLKIWYSSISQNVRKLVVNRKINSQVPLVAEPHRGDWGGYFWVTMRTLSACTHECLRQTEPTHLSNFCWISPHKWYLLEKWSGPV